MAYTVVALWSVTCGQGGRCVRLQRVLTDDFLEQEQLVRHNRLAALITANKKLKEF